LNWKYEASILGATGLMALISPEAGIVWVMVTAVFMANPLNYPITPDSLMNPLHPDNVDSREDVLRNEVCVWHTDHEDCVLIEWPDIAWDFCLPGRRWSGSWG
jgi:hypothetical protein